MTVAAVRPGRREIVPAARASRVAATWKEMPCSAASAAWTPALAARQAIRRSRVIGGGPPRRGRSRAGAVGAKPYEEKLSGLWATIAPASVSPVMYMW